MESFSLNSAKSLLGKHVNLHLKDGAVIINVQMTRVRKGQGKVNLLEFTPYGKHKATQIPMRCIAWAEQLSPSLFQTVN